MPVKNGADYIEEALDGIKRQKMNVEIIVVNDGSSDNTAEIATAMGCKLINNPVNLGNIKARNIGLRMATGNFIMFHDHDDVMRDGALHDLYFTLDENPEYMAVMAKVQDFVSPELDEIQKRSIKIKAQSYYGLLTGAALFRKEVFDIIGVFDENLKQAEGLELQMRLRQYNIQVKQLDIVAANRRVHISNISRTGQSALFEDQTAILRAKLRGLK